MKRRFLTLLLPFSTSTIFAQSYGHNDDNTGTSILVGIFAFAVWVIILWQIVNNASRANRLVKIQLMQLDLSLRHHNKVTGENLTLTDLAQDQNIHQLHTIIKNVSWSDPGDLTHDSVDSDKED